MAAEMPEIRRADDDVKCAGGMRPADIGRIRTVESPAVSPDGMSVAYLVTYTDLNLNSYRSAIWLASTDGSAAPRQLTSGQYLDGAPVWSPDGRHLAFASRRGPAATPFTLHLLPFASQGELITLAARDEPLESPDFSPDGRRMVFISRVRADRYTTGSARQITRLFPRRDGIGWMIDRPAQVFVVPADASLSARQITEGGEDCQTPVWSPDSRHIAFVSARGDYADLNMTTDIWECDVDDFRVPPRRVTSASAVYRLPSWSPDGSRLAAIRQRGPHGGRQGWRHGRIVVIDVASGREHLRGDDLDLHHLVHNVSRAPLWHGDDLIVLAEESGTVPILLLSARAGHEYLVTGPRTVTGYDYRQGVLAFTATDMQNPAELFVLRNGTERPCTAHQEEFSLLNLPLPAEHFAVPSEDGCVIDAWVMRPAGFDPARRYPVILSIHGGPQTQYGERWFDEFQLYAGAGFAVLFCNPHGSTGKDEHFARSYYSAHAAEDPGNGWGGIDYRDLIAVANAALERFAFLDSDRMGVMGGSYGGGMTVWILTQTNRFRAACAERALTNMASAEGAADMAGLIKLETGIDPLESPEEIEQWSPFRYASSIETALLILHGDLDLRLPPDQADSLFVALRLQRKAVEYWRFPGEGHDMSRSGTPAHRVERAELIIEWFQRQLTLAAGAQI